MLQELLTYRKLIPQNCQWCRKTKRELRTSAGLALMPGLQSWGKICKNGKKEAFKKQHYHVLHSNVDLQSYSKLVNIVYFNLSHLSNFSIANLQSSYWDLHIHCRCSWRRIRIGDPTSQEKTKYGVQPHCFCQNRCGYQFNGGSSQLC